MGEMVEKRSNHPEGRAEAPPLSLAGNGLMAGIQAASSSGPLRALQIPRMLSAFQPDCAAWRAESDIFTE